MHGQGPQSEDPVAGHDGRLPVTPAAHRLLWSGILKNVGQVAPVALIEQSALPIDMHEVEKDRKRKAPTKAQMDEIRLSIVRQWPVFLPQYVPGCVVAAAARERRLANANQFRAQQRAQPQDERWSHHPPRPPWIASTATGDKVGRPGCKTPQPPVSLVTQTPESLVAHDDPRKITGSQAVKDAMKPPMSQEEKTSLPAGCENSAKVSPPEGASNERAAQADESKGRQSNHVSHHPNAENVPTDSMPTVAGDAQATPDGSTDCDADSASQRPSSAQLREILDSRYSGYLGAEKPMAPMRKLKPPRFFVIPEAEDDLDYVPTSKQKKNKRKPDDDDDDDDDLMPKQSTKKRRDAKAGGRKATFAASPTTTRAATSKPLLKRARAQAPQRAEEQLHAAKPGELGSPAGGDQDSDDAPVGRPQRSQAAARPHARRRPPHKEDAAAALDDDGRRSALGKTRKNSDAIFGIYRHQELAGPLQRTEQAKYAWSAETAHFAVVAERAQYARKADGIVRDAGPLDDGETTRQFATLARLRREFDAIEAGQRSKAAQDANEARFAGCADRAVYATEAKEARFAMEVRQVQATDG
ncbi:hypothetical protein UVI_02062440 [Ustilaginoidea virens]|nr:hypothetical protein UVI_02062440 [Ustilaginoidea virens]